MNEAAAKAHDEAARLIRAWEATGCEDEAAREASEAASAAAHAADPAWESEMTERQEQAATEGEEAYAHELRARQLRCRA